MLSFKSDTFQTTRQEILELQNNLKDEGKSLSGNEIDNILNKKNINKDEFKQAENEYQSFKNKSIANLKNEYRDKRDKATSIQEKGNIEREFDRQLERLKQNIVKPEGFRLGRLVAGAVGEAGRDVKDFASTFAPKTTEAISGVVDKAIPDTVEKDVSAFFDPYMGKGLGADIDRFVSDIGSFFVTGGPITKGIAAGATFIKTGKGLGPNAIRLRKYGRLGKYGLSGAASATIGMGDDVSQERFEEAIDTLDKNPNDSKANQYFDSFLENLAYGAVIPGAVALRSVFRKGSTRDALIKKLKKKKDLEAKKKTEVESIPISKLSRIVQKRPTLTNNLVVRLLSPTRGTDKFTVERTLLKEGAAGKAIQEADGLTQDLLKAVNQVRGKDKAIIDDLIQKVLETGDKQALNKLQIEAPKVHDIVKKMQTNLSGLRKSISKNIKDEELKAIYDPNKKEVYLNRAYRIHDDPNFNASIKKLDSATRNNIENFLRKEIGIKDDDIPEAMQDLIRVGKGQESKIFTDIFGQSVSTGGSSTKTYMARTKLANSKDIRSLWGEVKDPYKNYARTYEKLSTIKAEADFLTDMADYLKKSGLAVDKKTLSRKGIESGLLREGQDIEEPFGLEKVGQEKLKRVFGARATSQDSIINPLKNLYVNPAYKKFIEEGTDVLSPQNPIIKKFLQYKVLSQTTKTIANPATHGRNIMGNMILMVANGMLPFSSKGNALKQAANKITGYNNEKLGKKLGRYQELNITDSGVNQETLRRAAGQVFNFEPNTILSKTANNKTTRLAQNLYQVEDDFFKIVHFEKTLGELQKIAPKLTKTNAIDSLAKKGITKNNKNFSKLVNDELKKLNSNRTKLLEEEAASRTRELMPNYGLVGRGFKQLRSYPLGDFIAFPAEMVRVSYNLGKRSLKDISGATAEELEQRLGTKISREAKNTLVNRGYKRLAGMTVAGTAGENIMGYTANRLGITSDDQQAIENLGNDYEKGAAKIFLSRINADKNNHIGVDYISLGPIDPFNYLKAPAMAIGKDLAAKAQGKPTPYYRDDYWTAMKQVFSPFLGTSMVTDAFIKSLNTLEDDQLNNMEKALEIGSTLTKVITPPFVTQVKKEIEYADSLEKRKEMGLGAVSKYDYTIPEIEMEGVLSNAKWLGIRPQRLDISAGMYRQIAPTVNKLNQTSNMRNFVNNPNSPRGPERAEKFKEAYLKDQIKRKKRYRDLKKIVDSYGQLGLDYDEIFSGLSKDGLRKVDINNIIEKMEFAKRNQYEPSFIPDNLIPYAEEYTGGPLPYDEIGKLFQKLFTKKINPDEE